MSLARRLLTAGGEPLQPGQVEWTVAGFHDFIVPQVGDGVYNFDLHFISAVMIGAGGVGTSSSPFPGGGGGGLHWLNDIPVTPGETLTVEVGSGVGVEQPRDTRLLRGAEVLMLATRGSVFGSPGLGRFDLYGGGGGNGGGAPSGSGNGGLGGGAAGYMGNGGRGGNLYGPAGQYPVADSGGGRGGNTQTPGNGWGGGAGEGVGLQGRTSDFAYGSRGAIKCGAGNPNQGIGGSGPGPNQHGGARIMWGRNEFGPRSYPDNAWDV